MKPRTRYRILLALVTGSLSLACESTNDDRDKTDDSVDKNKVEQIEDDPDRFIGKEVTVTGEVDDVYSDRSFELEGNDWLFDREILILTRSPMNLTSGPFVADDEVIVTGTVRYFHTAEIEREVGWDLDAAIETEWSSKPVIVANSVRKVQAAEGWNEPQARR